MTVKCNSVTDLGIIQKLSEASCAGVHVNMIVRGICCLLPGIEGATENIEVISIVGRLLEHSRIYCFGSGDDAKVYLASADLMTRNTERRVEIGFPVESPEVRKRVLKMIAVLLSDTACAQKLMPDGSYVKLDACEDGCAANEGKGGCAESEDGCSTPAGCAANGEGRVNAQTFFMEEAVEGAAKAERKRARAKSESAADAAVGVAEAAIPVANASVKTSAKTEGINGKAGGRTGGKTGGKAAKPAKASKEPEPTRTGKASKSAQPAKAAKAGKADKAGKAPGPIKAPRRPKLPNVIGIVAGLFGKKKQEQPRKQPAGLLKSGDDAERQDR